MRQNNCRVPPGLPACWPAGWSSGGVAEARPNLRRIASRTSIYSPPPQPPQPPPPPLDRHCQHLSTSCLYPVHLPVRLFPSFAYICLYVEGPYTNVCKFSSRSVKRLRFCTCVISRAPILSKVQSTSFVDGFFEIVYRQYDSAPN